MWRGPSCRFFQTTLQLPIMWCFVVEQSSCSQLGRMVGGDGAGHVDSRGLAEGRSVYGVVMRPGVVASAGSSVRRSLDGVAPLFEAREADVMRVLCGCGTEQRAPYSGRRAALWPFVTCGGPAIQLDCAWVTAPTCVNGGMP